MIEREMNFFPYLTGDEMWVLYVSIESKQYMQCHHSSSPKQNKNSNKPNEPGNHGHYFIGQKIVLLVEFMEQD